MLAIKNNLMAVNAARHLGQSYDALSRSVERLSSGMRINSAKDDAAGLAGEAPRPSATDADRRRDHGLHRGRGGPRREPPVARVAREAGPVGGQLAPA